MKVILWTLILSGLVLLAIYAVIDRENDLDRMQELKADARQANDRYKLDRATGVYSDYPLKEGKK